MIRDSVTTALETTIPAVTNKALIKNDGFFHLIPSWWLDWESPSAAIVTSDYWAIAMKGLMFNNSTGEIVPDVAVPKMTYKENLRILLNPLSFKDSSAAGLLMLSSNLDYLFTPLEVGTTLLRVPMELGHLPLHL